MSGARDQWHEPTVHTVSQPLFGDLNFETGARRLRRFAFTEGAPNLMAAARLPSVAFDGAVHETALDGSR
jgi:hypothetical protein